MLPEDFRIIPFEERAIPLLENLLRLYYYDMSEWFGFDTDETGAFSIDLAPYLAEGFTIFLAFSGKLPVGFAVVQSAEKTGNPDGFDVKEFFILRKFRRTGAGHALARHLWDAFPGSWVVRVYGNNRPAIPFWRKTIATYTSDQFKEETRSLDNGAWVYFFFQNDGLASG